LEGAAAVGLCARRPDDHYELTEAGRLLAADDHGSARGWLMLMTQPWMTRAWERLADAIRSGDSHFSDVNGSAFWEYVAAHPADVGMFQAAMTSGAAERAADLAAAVHLREVRTVVDVGGGEGKLAAELLLREDHLRAVVADRPEVVSSPDPAVSRLGDRISMVAADFFEAVPPGGDVYVLSRILHDWADAPAAAILRRCRSAMSDDSLLVLLEQLAPDHEPDDPVARLELAIKDLNMLVLVGGRERSLADYAALLDTVGLTVVNTHHGDACDVIVSRPG
jgi:hypothetical protein